ncbi:MAG: hypothetical protein ACRD2C_09115 [Acidimicrobiales bacterium]
MANDPVEPRPGGEWSEFKDGKPAGKSRDRDVAPRAIVALLALVTAVIFVAQNRNRVETNFLFFDGNPRLWVVIVASLLLGALLGQAGALLMRRRKRAND